MASEWTMQDCTNGKNGGYYRVYRDGMRVFDAFPYATGADPEWIKHQIESVVATMNDAINGSQHDL